MGLPEARPLLIYDGDCGFCKYWVNYWDRLTKGAVSYAPYQDVGKNYPGISQEQFQKAIQYVAPDGKISSGAEASFRVLAHAPGKAFWLSLYKHLPGFTPLSEIAYAFIAKRRPAFYKISLFLWGRDYEPPRFETITWIFLRLLGLIFLAAFLSFAVQAQGLIGSHGILPLREMVSAAQLQMGPERYWLMPMVFWVNDSDAAIHIVCWAGVLFSGLLTIGVLRRLSLIVLCGLYLSLIYAGQTFMTFQWDLYLIETGFIAFLLCWSQETGIWLLRWLLFRFMFMGGAVKILSGDLTWYNFTALQYHFLTQPLPSPAAWYAHHLPPNILSFATAATLFTELVLPFLIFLPRNIRFVAGAGIFIFQGFIVLTGNYNFFNLLTMLLCLSLFDDAAVYNIIKWRRPAIAPPKKAIAAFVSIVAVWSVLVSAVQMDERFNNRLPRLASVLIQAAEPLHLVNVYGPFAVMTTQREEIVVEGSADGVNWKEYGFKYKPGDVKRGLSWNIPHQPRLDWQMWFAALGPMAQSPWFAPFMERLLENEPSVTALLLNNPFKETPPKYVRAMLYDYRFSTAEEKARDHAWWVRELTGLYFPAVQLNQRPSLFP